MCVAHGLLPGSLVATESVKSMYSGGRTLNGVSVFIILFNSLCGKRDDQRYRIIPNQGTPYQSPSQGFGKNKIGRLVIRRVQKKGYLYSPLRIEHSMKIFVSHENVC